MCRNLANVCPSTKPCSTGSKNVISGIDFYLYLSVKFLFLMKKNMSLELELVL